jgi:hypothetical protein
MGSKGVDADDRKATVGEAEEICGACCQPCYSFGDFVG